MGDRVLMEMPAWIAGQVTVFTVNDAAISTFACFVVVLAVYLPWKLRQ
tara:strand:- start:331 stop:474 length:144 start_codon:yes stop_codon:yes gene_type:complete